MILVRLFAFLCFYIKEVVVSNLYLAWDVMTPRSRMAPGIIALPLDPELSNAQVMFLSSLITMTPGTLSMDVEELPEGRFLYIHALYINDPDELREHLKIRYEQRLKKAVRL